MTIADVANAIWHTTVMEVLKLAALMALAWLAVMLVIWVVCSLAFYLWVRR